MTETDYIEQLKELVEYYKKQLGKCEDRLDKKIAELDVEIKRTKNLTGLIRRMNDDLNRGDVLRYPITPVPKPRQTQSDKWQKRPCVLRYRAFADECKLHGVVVPEKNAVIYFILPMPKSWSKKKKQLHDGQPHQQRPDLSNLLKALEDAVHGEDSHIYHYATVGKYWGYNGEIEICERTDVF